MSDMVPILLVSCIAIIYVFSGLVNFVFPFSPGIICIQSGQPVRSVPAAEKAVRPMMAAALLPLKTFLFNYSPRWISAD